MIEQGAGLPVPLLIGTNRDEWRLFTVLLGGDMEKVKAELSQLFGEAIGQVHEMYTQRRMDKAPDRAWIDMQGDRVFRIPALRQAEAQVRTGAPSGCIALTGLRLLWANSLVPVMASRCRLCGITSYPFGSIFAG